MSLSSGSVAGGMRQQAASRGPASAATPLSEKSDEFKRVEYLLQMCTRNFALTDVCVWHLGNAHQAVQFERRTRGMQCVPAWLSTRRLNELNTLESLHSKGFTLPNSGDGMTFTTGDLDLDPNEGTAHRFLLCQVGVGRAFVVDDPSEQTVVPEGYDSLYLALSTSIDGAGDAPDGGFGYRHDYTVMDAQQALPMYLVQFFIDPDGRNSETDFGAANRIDDRTPASIDKLYDRHDFFDPILYVPVSVRDKMVGSHSSGKLAQHKLIGIGDAYESAVNESLKVDPILAVRQEEIKSQLRAVDAKLRDVNRNAAMVEERIYKMLQEALFRLQDITQNKMSSLLAEEVELRRQLQQMEWMEAYLDLQREGASQVDFLNGWKCHVQLRADLARNSLRTATVLEGITADLELSGGVQIQSRSALERQQHAARATPDYTMHQDQNPFQNYQQPQQQQQQQQQQQPYYQQQQFQHQHQQHQQQPQQLQQQFSGETPGNGSSAQNASRRPSQMTRGQEQIQSLMQTLNLESPQAAASPQTAPETNSTSTSPAENGNQELTSYEQKSAESNAATPQAPAAVPPPLTDLGNTPSLEQAKSMLFSPASLQSDAQSDDEGVASNQLVATAPAPPQSISFTFMSKSTPPKYAQYSLRAEAVRRLRQLAVSDRDSLRMAERAFEESRLLEHPDTEAELAKLGEEEEEEERQQEDDEEDSEGRRRKARRRKDPPKRKVPKVFSEGQSLLLSVPFNRRREPPATRLLYATWDDPERSVEALINRLPSQRNPRYSEADEDEDEDELGATDSRSRKPKYILVDTKTMLIIKANGRIFGGFVDEPWRGDGHSFGTAKSFLFSVSLDIKVPFQGREAHPPPPDEDYIDDLSDLDDETIGELRRPFAVCKSNTSVMQFGTRDLVLRDNFTVCTSDLEHSFGVGAPRGSEEARTLLAGEQTFAVEALELWAIDYEEST